MSIRTRRLSYNDHGDPRLVIEIEGFHDIYRFANHLLSGQCEFADIGHRTIRKLKRRLRKRRWEWLMRYMHGDGGFR